MRILFLSDIHGNLPALEVLRDEIVASDISICLGDIVGYHCFVNEVIDYLVEYNVKCIQGNHDRYIFDGLDMEKKSINDSVRFGIDMANSLLEQNRKDWLAHLPTSLSFKVDDCSILCCHGSPWDVTNGYVYADSELLPRMSDFQYNVIALGHTHRGYTWYNNNQLILNPGSVGQARDFEGVVCAKRFDTNTKQVEIIHIPYDYSKTINHSISLGAKDWIYKHFKSII